jgi:hypothetical protein
MQLRQTQRTLMHMRTRAQTLLLWQRALDTKHNSYVLHKRPALPSGTIPSHQHTQPTYAIAPIQRTWFLLLLLLLGCSLAFISCFAALQHFCRCLAPLLLLLLLATQAPRRSMRPLLLLLLFQSALLLAAACEECSRSSLFLLDACCLLLLLLVVRPYPPAASQCLFAACRSCWFLQDSASCVQQLNPHLTAAAAAACLAAGAAASPAAAVAASASQQLLQERVLLLTWLLLLWLQVTCFCRQGTLLLDCSRQETVQEWSHAHHPYLLQALVSLAAAAAAAAAADAPGCCLVLDASAAAADGQRAAAASRFCLRYQHY